MKLIIAFAAFAAVVIATPQSADKDAQVVKSTLENIGVDGYNFAYETSNGIAASEQGQLVNPGSENEHISVRGSFTYAVEGVTYTVNYVADENGFQAEGAHIPK